MIKRTRMLYFIAVLVGIACIAFGYWGLHSKAGQEVFPEMAGIIPVLIQFFGYVLVALTIVFFLIAKFLSWKRDQ